jgi:RNase P subunit RPR2
MAPQTTIETNQTIKAQIRQQPFVMIKRLMKIKASHYLKRLVTKRCLNLLYLPLSLKVKIETQMAETQILGIQTEIQDQTIIEAVVVVAMPAAVVADVN